MVSEPEKARRRAKLNDIAASIRNDINAIRLAERLAEGRILPMTRRSFEEDLVQHEADWDAEDSEKT